MPWINREGVAAPRSTDGSILLMNIQRRASGQSGADTRGTTATPAALRSALAELAERFDLIAIYAFGSRAAEIAARVAGSAAVPTRLTASSDVDIGIVPARHRRLSARDRVQVMQALEGLFEVARVDLVVVPEVRTFLALDIVTGELLHSADAAAEARYQLYILRRAGDLAGWERERRRMIAAGEAI